MQTDLPKPHKDSLVYEDDKLYACLASFPITKGHTVVVWKERVADLHLLSKSDYEYLMDTVDEVRSSLLKTLSVEKVYLIYMDETKHVHWHLVPRYNEKGFDVFQHEPSELEDVGIAQEIKNNMKKI